MAIRPWVITDLRLILRYRYQSLMQTVIHTLYKKFYAEFGHPGVKLGVPWLVGQRQSPLSNDIASINLVRDFVQSQAGESFLQA